MRFGNSKILLVLVAQPLTRHTFARLGVNTKYKGWKIVYWNLLSFVNKKLNKRYSSKGYRLKNSKKYIKINSLNDLRKEVEKFSGRFYFSNQIGNNNFFISILDRYLSILGGKKIFIHPGKDPDFKIRYSEVVGDLMINNKIYLLKKIITHFLGKIINLICKLVETKPDVYFAGNYKTYLDFKNTYKKKKVFKIDSPEFENFLNYKKSKYKKKNNILFLDQVLEGSFDHAINYVQNKKINKKEYWKNIDQLFKLFSTRFKSYKMCVAAHPRRNINDLPIEKKFFFDQTLEQVKNSKLVLAHNSLAVKYAVLFRKPIIFINMEIFKLLTYETVKLVKIYSKELGSKIINIDENFFANRKKIKINKPFLVNKNRYKKFESNYINFPGLKPQGRWEKILESLDNY